MVLEALDCNGPVTIVSNACASGSNAIGHAWELIRYGQAERALTGGYDALTELVFSGLTPYRHSRPLSAGRLMPDVTAWRWAKARR